MEEIKNVTRITRDTLKTAWKTIWIHVNDHVLLRSYRAQYQISMVAVLHMLIGVGTKCVEEQHVKRIVFLEKQVGHMAAIIIVYRDKYGKLPTVSGQSAANEGRNTV